MIKQPAFWAVVVVVAVGVAAFSKARNLLKPVAAKIPGNDVLGS